MTLQPGESNVEYRFLKFSTHEKAETGLNEAIAEGWQLVNYQAAGGDSAITHFVLISREKQRERTRFGLGG